VDVDECATDAHDCQTPSTCTNTDGAFECHCPTGYDRTDGVCVLWYAEHHTALTDGVATVDGGGSQASLVVVHGARAFPVVQDAKQHTFIAAGELVQGRMVVFGHEAWLKPGLLDDTADDSGRLVRNAARWVAQKENPLVGYSPAMAGLATHLDADGLATVATSPASLDEVDVFCMEANAGYTDEAIALIQQFVMKGGGLIAGGQAWWWSTSHDNAPANYPGNWLANPAGMTWSGLGNVETGVHTVSAAPLPPVAHGLLALQAVQEHLDGGVALSIEEQRWAAQTVGDTLNGLMPAFPEDFGDYLVAAGAVSEKLGPVIPTEEVPVNRADAPLDALAVHVDTVRALVLPPDELVAHPAAADFPGAVGDSAETVTRTIPLTATYVGPSLKYFASNAGSPLWVSTGLYAAPGAPLTVTIPDYATDVGLDVLIGAHKDTLWNKDEWSRYPAITRAYPLAAQQTDAANAFGGLVYIRVPRGASMGAISVSIQGAVLAPRFVHGETTVAEWQETIRHYPAPFGELQHDSVVVTLPSTALAAVEDPTAMIGYIESVADTAADLAGFSQDRPRRERFVLDRQISVGWMHSGYPLMGHLASTDDFLNEANITEFCCWGMFHEFGHNHQWVDWLIPGTTETTVNLWSVYLNEKLKGVPSWETHEAITLEKRAERMQSYMDAGANFDDWSVWTALESYLQIQEAFGWETYTNIFGQYRALSAGAAPSSEQGIIDQWVVRLSNTVNKNLGPFYVTWGLPVSQTALDSIADLPDWEENPMKSFDVPPDSLP